MSRHIAARPIAVAVLAAAVLMAGCSSKKATTGGTSESNTPATTSAAVSVSPSAGSSTSTPKISGDTQAVKLYNEAMASLTKVTSVHLKGSATTDGDKFSLDLSFAKDKGAIGSITVNGGTMKIVSTSEATYIQADAQSYAAFGGGNVPQDALAAIAGKWLKIANSDASSAASAFGDLSAFTNLGSFTEAFAPSGNVSVVPGKKTINGKTAVGVLDAGDADNNPSILYIEDGGDHLPVAVVPAPSSGASASTDSGEIDFIDYNKPVTITPPSDAIDISQLLSLMASPSS